MAYGLKACSCHPLIVWYKVSGLYYCFALQGMKARKEVKEMKEAQETSSQNDTKVRCIHWGSLHESADPDQCGSEVDLPSLDRIWIRVKFSTLHK